MFFSYAGGPGGAGFDPLRGFADRSLVSSGGWGLAPAIEYSWSPRYGVIAGVQFTFAGHNASSYVAPEIAISMVF